MNAPATVPSSAPHRPAQVVSLVEDDVLAPGVELLGLDEPVDLVVVHQAPLVDREPHLGRLVEPGRLDGLGTHDEVVEGARTPRGRRGSGRLRVGLRLAQRPARVHVRAIEGRRLAAVHRGLRWLLYSKGWYS